MKFQLGLVELELVEGDITHESTDAIVNAANSALAGGGGVDGAIHRAAGPSIMEETNTRYPDGCPTGEAVITGAGDLDTKFIVHAVGPVYRDGQQGEPALLASAYRHSLQRASEHDCRSISFSAISTGVYGYPLPLAAEVVFRTIQEWSNNPGSIRQIRIVLFGNRALGSFTEVARALFTPPS